MIRIFVLPAVLCLSLGSCKPAPQPINYGADTCHFCRMTVVDRQHAAQLVTKKGKHFTFDATECLLNFTADNPELAIEFLLVSDYPNPGVLIPAQEATYLVSENLPSPMGANLNAFARWEDARETKATHGGHLYDWTEIRQVGKASGPWK